MKLKDNAQNNNQTQEWPESLPWIDQANLNKPPQEDKDWLETFAEQRYKRLVESLDEYFSESPADYQAFMRDLQRGLNEIEDWPRQQMEAIKKAKDCLRLHRLISGEGTEGT
jgi:hypothetical protein